MPSGLTYKIYDGTDTTLRGFALKCVRQLGAGYRATDGGETEMPRDKAPVLTVAKFYRDNVETAEKELEHWLSVKNDENLCKTLYDSEQHERTENNAKGSADKEELKNRYLDLLQKVESWNVDDEYDSLKGLMVQQLHESIDWDCRVMVPNTAPVPSMEEWIDTKIDSARKDIEYYKLSLAKEEQQVAETNAYLKGLYEAIDEFEKENKKK